MKKEHKEHNEEQTGGDAQHPQQGTQPRTKENEIPMAEQQGTPTKKVIATPGKKVRHPLSEFVQIHHCRYVVDASGPPIAAAPPPESFQRVNERT